MTGDTDATRIYPILTRSDDLRWAVCDFIERVTDDSLTAADVAEEVYALLAEVRKVAR